MSADTVDTVLLHALGLRLDDPLPAECYRNRFVAGPGHHSMAALLDAESQGLMERAPRPTFLASDDVVFRATEEGRQRARAIVLKARAGLTRGQRRYRAYLEVADAFEGFGDYLRHLSREGRGGEVRP